MIKIKGEKKFYFSDYINNKPSELSPENNLSAQLVFIPRSKHQDKNIHELADTLSKSFNEFLGMPATEYSYLGNKWLMNWINQSGYLTTEQGKKIKISNRKRLYTWLTRYLSKNHIKLIKGKTYYFSRSLSHYMIMDNYKINGRPILKTKPLNPCLFYKKYNKDICNY